MMCTNPIQLKQNGKTSYFPCGRCMSCRINRTSTWTLRLLYENYVHPEAVFLTLTYNEENLPQDNSLHKEHLQNFWKGLRQDLSSVNRKIKYFACGEYGDKNNRPHYHSIVFGLTDSEEDRELVKTNWRYCDSFLFDKKHKGIGTVTKDSMQYVTGYIQKKLFGDMAESKYGNRLAPFQVCSRGLGLEGFIKLDYEFAKENGYIPMGKHKLPIPRYFKDKLNIDVSSNKEFSLMHKFDVLMQKCNLSKEDIVYYKLNGSDVGVLNSVYQDKVMANLEQLETNLLRKFNLKEKKL